MRESNAQEIVSLRGVWGTRSVDHNAGTDIRIQAVMSSWVKVQLTACPDADTNPSKERN